MDTLHYSHTYISVAEGGMDGGLDMQDRSPTIWKIEGFG